MKKEMKDQLFRYGKVFIPSDKVADAVKLLLPPHSDSEKAADFLRLQIGQGNPYIEWAAVRPDNYLRSLQLVFVVRSNLHPKLNCK